MQTHTVCTSKPMPIGSTNCSATFHHIRVLSPFAGTTDLGLQYLLFEEVHCYDVSRDARPLQALTLYRSLDPMRDFTQTKRHNLPSPCITARSAGHVMGR